MDILFQIFNNSHRSQSFRAHNVRLFDTTCQLIRRSDKEQTLLENFVSLRLQVGFKSPVIKPFDQLSQQFHLVRKVWATP
jgi:glycine cleavage system regulatory protein